MGAAWSASIGSRQKPKLGRGLQNRGRKRRTVLSGTKPGTGPYSRRRLRGGDPFNLAARIIDGQSEPADEVAEMGWMGIGYFTLVGQDNYRRR